MIRLNYMIRYWHMWHTNIKYAYWKMASQKIQIRTCCLVDSQPSPNPGPILFLDPPLSITPSHKWCQHLAPFTHSSQVRILRHHYERTNLPKAKCFHHLEKAFAFLTCQLSPSGILEVDQVASSKMNSCSIQHCHYVCLNGFHASGGSPGEIWNHLAHLVPTLTALTSAVFGTVWFDKTDWIH